MDVSHYFEKEYNFSIGEQVWTLPSLEKSFQSQEWELPVLMSYKKHLNEVKGRLNDFPLQKWHKHTTSMNPSGSVMRKIRNELDLAFLTQAWCKFYETVSRFNLIPQYAKEVKELSTVHLCEAPGAFVASLNHFLVSKLPDLKWDWMALTLNPHHEGNDPSSTVIDDRLILTTHEHWTYGADHTGDILNLENMLHIVDEAKRRGLSGKGTLLLVTADGSIDCQKNPAEQENVVSALQLCETVTAMHLLDPGGSFLLKAFTLFEAQTVCLLYLLACSFSSLTAWKPITSREGNSEMYLVCLGYKGKESLQPWLNILVSKYGKGLTSFPLFPLNTIPKEFLGQAVECAKTFMNYQVTAIEKNIFTFTRTEKVQRHKKRKNSNSYLYGESAKIQYAVAEEFFEKYSLEKIPQEAQIYPSSDLLSKVNSLKWLNDLYDQSGDLTFNKKMQESSYLERWTTLSGALEKSSLLKQYYNFDPEIFFQAIGAATCTVKPLTIELNLEVVSVGKPVDEVLCSKFCHVWFLNLHKQIQQLWSELSGPYSDETVNINQQSNVNDNISLGEENIKAIQNLNSEQSNASIQNTDAVSHDEEKQGVSETDEIGSTLVTNLNDFEVETKTTHDNVMFHQIESLTKEIENGNCPVFLWNGKICSEMIHDLLKIVCNVDEGGSFLVENSFPLLTRFQVGIIYLLSSIFHQLLFILPSTGRHKKMEFSIIFNQRRQISDNQSKVLDFLNEIAKLAQEKENEIIPQSILNIVPLKFLCEETFFSCITYVNHLYLENSGEELLRKCSKKLEII